MPTGSEPLLPRKAYGPTSHQSAIAIAQSASASYLYRARNLIERFFNKIKQCRRVATRYDKLAANYLAFVQLASIGCGWALMSNTALKLEESDLHFIPPMLTNLP